MFNHALRAGSEIRWFFGGTRGSLLRGQVAGKCFQNSTDHLFLALRFALARFDHAPLLAGEFFHPQNVEAAAHGVERLRKIVDDAVQKNFFFLDFANQPFVLEERIPSGLIQLLALGVGVGKIPHD